MRPKPPKVFDITSEGYYEHNRYFNEAEKCFNNIQEWVDEINSRLWNNDETQEITTSDIGSLLDILSSKQKVTTDE